MCEAAYNAASGTLVQMVHEGQASYCRAECPDHTFKAIKATSVQRNRAQAKTPEELLDAIPEAALRPEPWIQPVKGKPGTYVFDETVFENVPCLQWAQLLADCFLNEDVVPPPSAPGPKRSRGATVQLTPAPAAVLLKPAPGRGHPCAP